MSIVFSGDGYKETVFGKKCIIIYSVVVVVKQKIDIVYSDNK